mmetsp:Transcript_16744/g.23709  ORF Transcript_16744/g.23709 Transcript_16744/m.23709 type:complete len:167 (-) Transcript_16744:68-568(-)|eukprot:CAMPEP_0184865020 /NCGR_PEP_ID=MMETSP0580-20130426/16637_1 /TAXON_ID=1118495 /ORGANISM="Dactyliosolen fragilissimus" /LENGTH=166 /DNA_ID=CAMNT_0027364015 /DNA_START=55 /DNA_END=555 /DNA_ORIENTATION=-
MSKYFNSKSSYMMRPLFPLVFSCIFFFQFATSTAERLPFTLGVRDSLMIAHSFHNHPSFGPAGGMHGATYTCDVEFCSSTLEDKLNWVIDIGKASEILSNVLSKYNLKNLDEVFSNGEFTTTEFMAQKIHEDITEKVREEVSNFQGNIRVKLYESHKAWASFEGEV